MRKKRAIRNFAGIIFLCLVVLIFTIISFPVPGSDYNFMGFARGINVGIDYKGGAIFSYDVYSADSSSLASKGLNDSCVSLEYILAQYNYNANVYKTSDSSINVEVEFNGIDDEFKYVTNVVNLNNELSFKISGDDTVYLTGYEIKNVTGLNNNGTYGVYIEFTQEGQEKFAQLTKTATQNGESSGTVEIYVGVSSTPFTQITVKEVLDQKAVFISGSMTSLKEAEVMASRMNSTKYRFTFEENSKVIVSKNQANENVIKSIIIVCSIFAIIVAYLVCKFRMLGLCGVLALLVALLCQILLLVSLPNVILTANGLIASVLTMCIGGIICSVLFEKMKNEYAVGKKIHASVKFGFKKTFAYILDMLAISVIAMFALLIFGSSMVKQFAVASLIGLVSYGLSCLLLTYVFSKLYVDLNPTKAKKYGFKREAHVDELK